MKLEIAQIRPCITDKDKIMAKAYLNREIDFVKAVKNLSSHFNFVVKSDELKAIKIEEAGSIILIFSNGEIVLRQMDSEKQIFEISRKIAELV